MPFTVMGLPTAGTSQGILGMHLATMQRVRSMPSILGFSQMRMSVSPSVPLATCVTKPPTAACEDILSDQRLASSAINSLMVSSAYLLFTGGSGGLGAGVADFDFAEAVDVFLETGLGWTSWAAHSAGTASNAHGKSQRKFVILDLAKSI